VVELASETMVAMEGERLDVCGGGMMEKSAGDVDERFGWAGDCLSFLGARGAISGILFDWI
jgi:hypothetical protein